MKSKIKPFPPSAVLFDMDGVICDTRCYHLRAFQELMAKLGRDLTEERFQHLFGMENRKLLPTLLEREMGEAEIRELADWKEARYRELIATQIELMPGVAAFFRWLRDAGCRIAVASSAPRANVEQILTTTGLLPFVDAYLGSEDVERHKPDPLVFLTAAQRVGARSEEAWVIEDSLHGIEAGLAAGITTLAVATTHPAEELSLADAVFNDVAEIHALLRRAA